MFRAPASPMSFFSLLKGCRATRRTDLTAMASQILQDGYGSCAAQTAPMSRSHDVYLSPSADPALLAAHRDTVAAASLAEDNERYFALLKSTTITSSRPRTAEEVNFENLTPLFPDERYQMERG